MDLTSTGNWHCEMSWYLEVSGIWKYNLEPNPTYCPSAFKIQPSNLRLAMLTEFCISIAFTKRQNFKKTQFLVLKIITDFASLCMFSD